MINTSPNAEREIVVERLFEAPREAVWNAWTERRTIDRWFGPKGFTNTTADMDVRPGGFWRFVMHDVNGLDYKNKVEYIEVIKPEKLVYKHNGDKENDPDEFQVTVLFEEIEGNKTKLTMIHLFRSVDIRRKMLEEVGALEGAKSTLEKLAVFLHNSTI